MSSTTRKPSKRWKAVQALGCLGTLTAIALFFVAFSLIQSDRSHLPRPLMATMFGLIMVSMPLYWLGRVGAWWTAD